MRPTLFFTLLLLAARLSLAQENQGERVTLYSDQDFEGEKLTWSFWPSESQTKAELDKTVAQHGRQSLRLTAVSGSDRAFVLTSLAVWEPEALYRVAIHLRRDPSVRTSAISFFLNFREAPGKPVKGRQYAQDVRRGKSGEWERWSGCFQVTKEDGLAELVLGVEHTVGRVWFDNILIEKLGKASDTLADVWTNKTVGVEIGSGPLRRFDAHRTQNTPIFQMAQRFNRLLWRSALLERDLRDLERCGYYTGRALPGNLRQFFDSSERQLNEAFLAYTKAHRAGAKEADAAFASAADRLAATLDEWDKALSQARSGLRPVKPPALPSRLGRSASVPSKPTGA